MKKILYILIFLVVTISTIILLGLFAGKDIFSTITFGQFGYPSFKVSKIKYTLAKLNSNTKANLKFYQTNEIYNFDSEEGGKMKKVVERQVLQSMIENALIEKIAKENEISISDQEIQENLDMVIENVGDKEIFTSNLSKMFGWTLEDFKNNIVKNQVTEQKLQEYLSDQGGLDQDAINKINDILEKANSGESFDELAKQYSECPSGAQGGNLGAFAKLSDDTNNKYPHMVPEFEEATFALEPGEISGIVKTQFGYHIIKLEEKTIDDEGVPTVSAKHILIKSMDFGAWFENQKKSADVKIYLNSYVWDAENGTIKFKDEEMNVFEKEKGSVLEDIP